MTHEPRFGVGCFAPDEEVDVVGHHHIAIQLNLADVTLKGSPNTPGDERVEGVARGEEAVALRAAGGGEVIAPR